MKKYILIAGVNGSGKSTLYQVLLSLHNMLRVNSDEILKEFGNWKSPDDVLKAGKIAARRISQYIDDNQSFSQETTLCGRTVIKNIKKAKEKGYFIELHYVGVECVEIAKERVLKRVRQGGHGVSEKDIERRYEETFKSLEVVLPICDLTAFYDNSDNIGMRRFAFYKNGYPKWVSHNVPQWYENRISKQPPGAGL